MNHHRESAYNRCFVLWYLRSLDDSPEQLRSLAWVPTDARLPERLYAQVSRTRHPIPKSGDQDATLGILRRENPLGRANPIGCSERDKHL
jgi:hypothetical protein